MIMLRTMPRLGPWLLGLFLVAQVAGILPLMILHVQHALESQQAALEDIDATGVVDHGHEQHGHHRHGPPDENDQCCTIYHHLAGVLFTTNVEQGTLLAASIIPLPQCLLAGTNPDLPERPPKLLLSV